MLWNGTCAQVQCLLKGKMGHKRCAKWVGMKNVPSQLALLEWIDKAPEFKNAEDHKAAAPVRERGLSRISISSQRHCWEAHWSYSAILKSSHCLYVVGGWQCCPCAQAAFNGIMAKHSSSSEAASSSGLGGKSVKKHVYAVCSMQHSARRCCFDADAHVATRNADEMQAQTSAQCDLYCSPSYVS